MISDRVWATVLLWGTVHPRHKKQPWELEGLSVPFGMVEVPRLQAKLGSWEGRLAPSTVLYGVMKPILNIRAVIPFTVS